MLPELALILTALAFATPPPAVPEGTPLNDRFPDHLPGPEVLARWELIQGSGDSGGQRVAYRFYVEPARAALYRVTQYRLLLETEKLLWNGQPGRGQPLELYELLSQGWTRMDSGTERYRAEMATAIRIYQLHRTLTTPPQP
jgi:hypothetical protein